ncbi:MAG: 4Fe-4S binding protein [Oscillospiraceae bacterium]|nr:4Fe-4S binding protein [Oscillospiraceae bacterium]
MTSAYYFDVLVHKIHRTILATVDDKGIPVTAAIDRMDTDGNSLFFLTAKGKNLFPLVKKAVGELERGYYITDRCIGCGSCAVVCPQSCIRDDTIPYVIQQEHCLYCGNCYNECPTGAIIKRG